MTMTRLLWTLLAMLHPAAGHSIRLPTNRKLQCYNFLDGNTWCKMMGGDHAYAKPGQQCYDDFQDDCLCEDGYSQSSSGCEDDCHLRDPHGWCQSQGGPHASARTGQQCYDRFQDDCRCDDGYLHTRHGCEECNLDDPDEWCQDIGGRNAFAKSGQRCYDEFTVDCLCRYDGNVWVPETEDCDEGPCNFGDPDGFCISEGGQGAYARVGQDCYNMFSEDCDCELGYLNNGRSCEDDGCNQADPNGWCRSIGGSQAVARAGLRCYSNFQDHCRCSGNFVQLGNQCVEQTPSPTQRPTDSPTDRPTLNPTAAPTAGPTRHPTPFPTLNPTPSPTPSPTPNPTPSPTPTPTPSPTSSPTPSPTPTPTTNTNVRLSLNRTSSPTDRPTLTSTPSPTLRPTPIPTDTGSPTASPTPISTASPLPDPTPSLDPLVAPTTNSTDTRTARPTDALTAIPTDSPTASPTSKQTNVQVESSSSTGQGETGVPSKETTALATAGSPQSNGIMYMVVGLIVGGTVVLLLAAALVCVLKLLSHSQDSSENSEKPRSTQNSNDNALEGDSSEEASA